MQMNDVSPTGPAAFGVIAERFRRAGQPEKAATLCREGLEKFPEHLSARVTLGWSLLDMGEHQEAFDQLKSVLKRAPDNLAAIRGLAELHERGIGLVFDSISEFGGELAALDEDIDPVLPEPDLAPAAVAAVAMPEALDDLDPIVEPEVPALAADASEPLRFEIEDVIDETEADPMFDMSGIFASDTATSAEPAVPPARTRRPISLFGAPLALRDGAHEGTGDELHAWLDRVRDRRSESVSQSMAS